MCYEMLSSMVMYKGTHSFMSDHGETFCANCSNVFWLTIRDFSQSCRCSDCMCSVQCHLCPTLWWLWQLFGNTHSTTVRHHLTSPDITFVACLWYHLWIHYSINKSFITLHKFWKIKYPGFIWFATWVYLLSDNVQSPLQHDSTVYQVSGGIGIMKIYLLLAKVWGDYKRKKVKCSFHAPIKSQLNPI